MISTFCAYGQQEGQAFDDKATHARCTKTGQSCDCECHGVRHSATPNTEPEGDDVTLEELREHQTASNGAASPQVAAVVPGKRRSFTPEQKHAIAREYSEAPSGTGRVVMDKYGLSYSVIMKWCEQFGFATKKRSAREAPPEPQPTPELDVAPEPEPVEDVDDNPDDELALALTFDQDELDVLDAAAFLEGVDRYQLVGGLITEWIALHATDPDIKLCVAARRGHREEATA